MGVRFTADWAAVPDVELLAEDFTVAFAKLRRHARHVADTGRAAVG